MQQSDDYILHGRRGELARVPAQKTALPLDPVGHTQRLELFRAPDGVIYAAQCSVLSRSEDEGRSWEHLTRTVAPGPAGEPPQMPDDHFLNMRVLPGGEWIRARTDNENGAERETASAANLTPSEVAISSRLRAPPQRRRHGAGAALSAPPPFGFAFGLGLCLRAR